MKASGLFFLTATLLLVCVGCGGGSPIDPNSPSIVPKIGSYTFITSPPIGAECVFKVTPANLVSFSIDKFSFDQIPFQEGLYAESFYYTWGDTDLTGSNIPNNNPYSIRGDFVSPNLVMGYIEWWNCDGSYIPWPIHFVATLLPPDSDSDLTWNLPTYAPTTIVPRNGQYRIITDHDITDKEPELNLKLESNECGSNMIFNTNSDDQFSSAIGSDIIEVENGTFKHALGTLDENHPSHTDSFAISGHFVTLSKIEGTIKLAKEGAIIAETTFTAIFSALDRWAMPEYSETNIVPELGEYHFEVNYDTGSHQPHIAFAIKENDSGIPVLLFSSEHYRYDEIPITNGMFIWNWGVVDGGIHHPTDSYAISGHFTDLTHAEGTIKHAYAGKIYAEGTFTTTLE